jgi:hypothetical protein
MQLRKGKVIKMAEILIGAAEFIGMVLIASSKIKK